MFMQQLYRLSEIVCKWIHPSGLSKTTVSFEILILIVYKAQEMAIVIDQTLARNYEMSLIASFSNYSLFADSNKFEYFEAALYIFFIVHLASTLMFIENIYTNKMNNQSISYQFLHNYLLYYTSLLYTPVLYSSLKFFYQLKACNIEQLCSNQYSIVIMMISIFNLINCMIMKFVHIYFARSCSIMGDNNILQLQSSFSLNVIQETLVFISVCFKIVNFSGWIRLIFICLKQLLSMMHQLNKINCQPYALFKVVSISTVIASYFAFQTCEYLLISCFAFYIVLNFISKVKCYYILNQKFESLISIQIIENSIANLNNQQNLINLLIIYKIHKCGKCSSPYQMSHCLFQKITHKSQDLEKNLLYCEYLSERLPQKALIKILNIRSLDLYFNGAQKNLINFLNNQSQYMLKQFQKKAKLQKLDDCSNQLNVNVVLQIFRLEDDFFPLFKRVILGKINFWNHLMRGYSSFNTVRDDALTLAKLMILCKEKIKDKFDLDNFKIKQGVIKEVISMKILQIYYSAIYNNQYVGQELEKQIEDLLQVERFKGIEPLSCIQMIENKIFIFQSSLLQNKGKLINLDIKKLAVFFNQMIENIRDIDHCSQVMPDFIAEIHDTLINRYIQKGFTMLQVQYQQTYLKNISGYLEQCVLNLMSYHDVKNNDLIMNALVSKVQGQETLLFGVDGVILGCTQQFFEKAIKQPYCESHLNENNFNVSSFLEKKPLIQYFIPNICQQIEGLQDQFRRTQSTFLNNLNAQWIIPTNFQNQTYLSSKYLEKFRGVEIEELKQRQRKSQYSQSSKLTVLKQDSIFYSLKQSASEELKDMQINGQPIILLHPEFQNLIYDNLELNEHENSKIQINLSYDINFNCFQFSKTNLGYFTISIKDFKIKMSQNEPNPSKLSQKVLITENQSMIQDESQLVTEKMKSHLESIENIIENKKEQNQTQRTQLISKENEAYNVSDENISCEQRIKYTNAQKLFDSQIQIDTLRGNQIQQSTNKIVNFSEEMIEFQENSKQIFIKKQRKEDANKKTDVKVQTPKRKEDQNNDFGSTRSRASADSFQKASQILVDQFCSKSQLISPLKNILYLMLISLLGIFLSIILNYYLVSETTIQQTESIQLMVQPQNITYFYCSVFYQLWSIELDAQGFTSLSKFQKNRNLEILQQMFDSGSVYMQQLNIKIPQISKDYELYDFKVSIKTENQLQIITQPLETFYQMIYEKTEISYRANLNQDNNLELTVFPELHTSGILRQNIIQLSSEINNLVQLIGEDTIQNQSLAEPVFKNYIIIQLVIMIALFICQIRYWLLFDKIQKRIIFLIATLNEVQATEQILKLQKVKSLLEENSSKWKTKNFTDLMQEATSNRTMSTHFSITDQVKRTIKYNSESSLSTRIKKTNQFTKLNFLILALLIITWAVYIVVSFFIYSQQLNNFYPSLIATLKYGQFKTKMDIVSYLGGLIKTEAIPSYNNISNINQAATIDLFVNCQKDLMDLINEISDTILENAYKNNKVSRFDSFLNGNICLLRPWENIKACDPSKSNLPFNNNDSIQYLLSSGILGYTASFIKYLNSEFDFEIQNRYYSSVDENQIVISQKQFQNFFLSYFCDTQDTLQEFLQLFQAENHDIASQIIFTLELYYFAFGTSYLAFLLICSIYWIYNSQTKVMLLRQIFALIPCELIQNPNIKTRAKLIYSWLY